MSTDALHATLPLVPGDQLAIPVHIEDEFFDAPVDVGVAGDWSCDVTDVDGNAIEVFIVSVVGVSTNGDLLLSMVGTDSVNLTQGMLVTLRNITTDFTWARWAIKDELCG